MAKDNDRPRNQP